ncbi:MAG: YbaB/EbfC family nucleoid-associated protein [Phycisphaerae bacterium]|nr:YbaB/EbfC family nucleoid-associated protein [Tepidisphaeraceae bacterium]
MFDDLKNMNLGNLGDLMSKAQEMRSRMERMQEEAQRKTVTADAGGGMVQATVNGKMELTKLKIDKTKLDVNDTELLEDVIIAAVNAAQQRAANMLQEEMRKQAQQMGLPPGMIPGM